MLMTTIAGVHDFFSSSDPKIGASIVRLANFARKEHEHPEAQVSILFKAESATFVTHNATGRTIHTPAFTGAIAYIPPNQPHRTHWSGDAELLNLHFPGRLIEEVTDGLGSALAQPAPEYRFDRGIFEVGRLLLDEFDWTANLTPAVIDHAAMLVAHRLHRISTRHLQPRAKGLLPLKRLQPAIDFIAACPEAPFTLSQLARFCNASTFHFARSFSAAVGCPPFSYQRRLRLEKARQLLAETDLSIEAVGHVTGVGNATYFSRLFRHYNGVSPSEYRRRLHEH